MIMTVRMVFMPIQGIICQRHFVLVLSVRERVFVSVEALVIIFR